MKKLIATVCVIGSGFALSACETTGMGYVDTAPPYEMERTAKGTPTMSHDTGMEQAPVTRSAEPVFTRSQRK